MRNAGSVEIDQPIDDVFRLTNDHYSICNIPCTHHIVTNTFNHIAFNHRNMLESSSMVNRLNLKIAHHI